MPSSFEIPFMSGMRISVSVTGCMVAAGACGTSAAVPFCLFRLATTRATTSITAISTTAAAIINMIFTRLLFFG